jgi:hypothetical protein
VRGRARGKARLHPDSTQAEAEVGKREAPAKMSGSIEGERLEWNRCRRNQARLADQLQNVGGVLIQIMRAGVAPTLQYPWGSSERKWKESPFLARYFRPSTVSSISPSKT